MLHDITYTRESMKSFPALLLVMAVAACFDTGLAPTSPPPPPPPPPPSTVRVAYCPAQQPIWVAFQDGDGPWVQSLRTAYRAGVFVP